MADFLAAYSAVAQNEGGYVNDPNDPGGETYAGITRKNWPNWPGWAVIDAHELKHGDKLPELDPRVKQFYKANYWDKCRADLLDSQKVATFIYDWFVNSGTPALKALQRAAGVTVDGIVGPATILAANGYSENDLMISLVAARKKFYNDIVAGRPSQGEYLKGWLDRVDRLA